MDILHDSYGNSPARVIAIICLLVFATLALASFPSTPSFADSLSPQEQGVGAIDSATLETSSAESDKSQSASIQDASDDSIASAVESSTPDISTLTRKTIKAGTYKISSKSNGRKIQVRSAKTSSGARIVLGKANTSNTQKWYIRISNKSKKEFRIQSVQSGRYMTVKNGKVVEAKFSKSNSQIWYACQRSGNIAFVNKSNNKILKISGKTGLVLADRLEDGKTQLFSLKSASILDAGTYFIQVKSTTKVLGVTGNLTRAGSNVRLSSKGASANKKWTATLNSDGTYTFRNAYSARVLAVKTKTAKRGSNVYQGTLSSLKTKKWKLELGKNGGIVIRSALNASTCLGSATLSSGSNSKMITSSTAKSATFVFKKATKPSSRTSMDRRVKKKSSKTKWLLAVNTNSCFVGVYTGSKGKWTPYAYFPCSPGAPGTSSRKGTYRVGLKGYAFGTDAYTCYYYTQYCGNYLFHSILYNHGTFNVQDGRMGVKVSHGCIRLELVNAKWINRNIPVGTTVYVY